MHFQNRKCSSDRLYEINSKPGMVAHTCNPNIRERGRKAKSFRTSPPAIVTSVLSLRSLTHSEVCKILCPPLPMKNKNKQINKNKKNRGLEDGSVSIVPATQAHKPTFSSPSSSICLKTEHDHGYCNLHAQGNVQRQAEPRACCQPV